MTKLTTKQFDFVAAVFAFGTTNFTLADLDFAGTASVPSRLAKAGVGGLQRHGGGKWSCDLNAIKAIAQPNGNADDLVVDQRDLAAEIMAAVTDGANAAEDAVADAATAAAPPVVSEEVTYGDGTTLTTDATPAFKTYGDLYDHMLEHGSVTTRNVADAFQCIYQGARSKLQRLAEGGVIELVADAKPVQYQLTADYEEKAAAVATADQLWSRSASRKTTTTTKKANANRLSALLDRFEAAIEKLEALAG